MVLEATIICLDNSEWSRDGDYSPSRWEAQKDAANLICGVKTQSNVENCVGIVTMAGPRVEVLTAPTTDVAKILSAIHSANINGKCDLHSALMIAQLGLKHRQNKSQKQRIVAFVCSPVTTETEKLTDLGMLLRRNNVALDIVCFGCTNDVEKLQELQRTVNASDNSHLITIPPGSGILSDALMNTPIVQGDDAPVGGQQAGGFEEYGGVDPNLDPELAMALQLSLQEAGGPQPAQPQGMDLDQVEFDDDEQRLLQEAIKMSLDEDNEVQQKQEDEGNQVFQNREYVEDLLASLPGVDPKEVLGENEEKKEEEEKKE